MDSVTDICKYHFLWFVTIIQVKVISGHQVKKVKQKKFRDLELWYMFLGQIFAKNAKNDPKTLWSVKIFKTAPVAAIPVNPFCWSKSAKHDVTLTSLTADLLWSGYYFFDTRCEIVGRRGMASFKAKFLVLQELFAKNHRVGPFGPPSGTRVNNCTFNWAQSQRGAARCDSCVFLCVVAHCAILLSLNFRSAVSGLALHRMPLPAWIQSNPSTSVYKFLARWWPRGSQ